MLGRVNKSSGFSGRLSGSQREGRWALCHVFAAGRREGDAASGGGVLRARPSFSHQGRGRRSRDSWTRIHVFKLEVPDGALGKVEPDALRGFIGIAQILVKRFMVLSVTLAPSSGLARFFRKKKPGSIKMQTGRNAIHQTLCSSESQFLPLLGC